MALADQPSYQLAVTLVHLGRCYRTAGRPDLAEAEHRKGIEVCGQLEQTDPIKQRNQLAIISEQAGKPDAAEGWYRKAIAAGSQTGDRQGQAGPAIKYRRQARDAKRNYAGIAHEMKRFAQLIAIVVGAAAGDEQARSAVGPVLQHLTKAGGESAKLATAIERILAGERDADALCAPIEENAAMVVETILQAIADPSVLEALLAKNEAPA